MAIFCDSFAILFSQIKVDTGKTLNRTVEIYSLNGCPFRYSRKFKIDRVESYRMTHHDHLYRESRGAVFFFHQRGRGGEGVFFNFHVICKYVHLHTQLDSED